jgi:hypothetical protein
MPLLLLIPLIALAVFTLWVVVLPFSLWARYAHGRARRRGVGWIVRGNAWLLAISVPLFLASAWMAGRWVDHALRDGAIGLALGIAIGVTSLCLTRFEPGPEGLHYTPNRWVVLGLTILVALRLLAGWLGAWRSVSGEGFAASAAWMETGGIAGIGGVLIGYALAYTWGLRARLPRAVGTVMRPGR